MHRVIPLSTLFALLSTLAACSAAERAGSQPQPDPNATTQVGWYLQHAGEGRFQGCGQSQSIPIADGADLPARARAFGLTDDTPVYVRLKGSVRGQALHVTRVEQFGSPTPVRNCGMDGVVIPEAG